MGQIQWLGTTLYGDCPASVDQPSFLMALNEAKVLDVAFSQTNLRKNPPKAAIATVSKLALRVALAHTSYNPKWQPTYIGIPGDFLNFAATDCPSENRIIRGVHDYQSLGKYCPELIHSGVIESSIIGEEFEVNGAIINHQPYFFKILQTVWNGMDVGVLHYKLLPDYPGDIMTAATDCLSVLGLNNTTFYIEVIRTEDGCKINTVKSCLNTAIGTFSLLCDEVPLTQVEKWAAQSLSMV